MNTYKTSEKLVIWMRRNKRTQESVAIELGITRQTLITRMKDNSFKGEEMQILSAMGVDS